MKSESYCSDQVAGNCLAVGASFVFATIALVITIDTLPVIVATEARFSVCWVLAVLFMLYFKVSQWLQKNETQPTTGLHWFGPPKLRHLLFTKAALSFSWITLWWTALRCAPMGDCIAIVYCGPILTSLWSSVILNEKLPRLFPVQAALVSSGIFLIVDPPFLRMGLATKTEQHNDYTFLLIALLVNSFVPIVTRQTKACSWVEVEHVVAACSIFVFNPCLLVAGYVFEGTTPSLPAAAISEVGLIVTAALGAFAGVAMETKAYQLAEPGKAAMFRYIEVPYAYFLQHVGTPKPVASRAIFGAMLIVTSCLVGAWDQMQARQKKLAAEEALLGNGNGNVESS
eukprot:gnl/MRDRNA2_/MRDRNA2_16473_c0_seq1.p1 gnl/MRDRNA2_/MRDRNA2_16473_c0~~gnl/MRDRNA2_/MRDRNA2_16473_c0_seq1.p1  ORF type:complete len:342 (-),score=55.06 gnl/MRDRNA2_/MRDRNA2_16473_c0_seq1:103-1128(-)